MFVTLSFMGCLGPEDKRTVIDEEQMEVTRLVVTEEQLSQFPFGDDPTDSKVTESPGAI